MNDSENLIIRIHSEHRADGEEVQIYDDEHTGRLVTKRGRRYLFYEESGENPSKTRLIVDKDKILLKKTGSVSWNMHFEEKLEKAGNYDTAYGSFPIRVMTESVNISENEDAMRLKLEYSLINSESYEAKCLMNIEITKTVDGRNVLSEEG